VTHQPLTAICQWSTQSQWSR